MHTKRMKCTMIMLGCLFTAFFLSACSNGRYTYELEGGEQTKVIQESGDGQGGADQSAKESPVQAEEPADATADRTEKAADTGKEIYVQINGAVKYPGVYKVQDDARIFDVVELAGGMTEDAEPEAVNQALPVEDGQMIRICTQEEWELARAEETEPSAEQADDGLVDINTADVAELCTLPGVGQARAESILAYRQEHGSFQTVEEIKQVSGIKDGLYTKIKDKIKITQ